MLIAIIPVALIVCIWYLFYKKFIYKTKAQEIQEELYDLNGRLQRSEYIVKYEYYDWLDWDAYVIYKWDKKMIWAFSALYIMYFTAGLNAHKNF